METEELKVPELNEYTVNVKVQGYGLCLNMKIPAKDPDEALNLACGHEFRYQDEDPYVLLVDCDDYGDASALCTYETLEEAILHCGTITEGRWMLVQRDFGEDGGTVIKSYDDEY